MNLADHTMALTQLERFKKDMDDWQKLLMDMPDYQFSKKQIYCRGQLVEANIWREGQTKYLEMALSELVPVP